MLPQRIICTVSVVPSSMDRPVPVLFVVVLCSARVEELPRTKSKLPKSTLICAQLFRSFCNSFASYLFPNAFWSKRHIDLTRYSTECMIDEVRAVLQGSCYHSYKLIIRR